MRRLWHSRLLLAAGAIAACAVVLALSWPSLFPNRLVIVDPTFHLTSCTITSPGTNHTLFSGDKLLAKLNQKLRAALIPPISDARMYKVRTAEPGILLGLGFRYDRVGHGADESLAAAVLQPDGTTVPLTRKLGTTVVAASGEHLCLWLMPGGMTNLEGCELRFSSGGKQVASIRL